MVVHPFSRSLSTYERFSHGHEDKRHGANEHGHGCKCCDIAKNIRHIELLFHLCFLFVLFMFYLSSMSDTFSCKALSLLRDF